MSGEPRDFMRRFVGQQIPGGCDECDDPYQTVQMESFGFRLTVHHDDDCPRLARYEGRVGNRAERRSKR